MPFEQHTGVPWDAESQRALSRSIATADAIVATIRAGGGAVITRAHVEWVAEHVPAFGD